MLSGIESLLLLLSFFCLMIGIGSSLEKQDVLSTLRTPKPMAWGLGLQYLLLPTLACALALGLKLDPVVGGTLLLIASCPGGSTSNMFTYFARANVPLSLLLTFLTTLNAFWVTPLLLWLFSSQLPLAAAISIPLPNLMGTLVLALLPVFLGFAVRLKSVHWAQRLERIGSRIGYASVLAMVVIWYPKMKAYLLTTDSKVFVTTGLLSFCGILCALLMSRLAGLAPKEARTLSFETGIQNAPLAFAIMSLNLSKELAQSVGWIPLVYGALSVGNAALFTLFYRLWDRYLPAGTADPPQQTTAHNPQPAALIEGENL